MWDKHHDAGEEMLGGITLEGEDYGKWPDMGDRHLSGITLLSNDFGSETPWPELQGQSKAPSSEEGAGDMMRLMSANGMG
jgi:hypothetical protein